MINQGSARGLTFTANIYPLARRIDKEASKNNLVIIILDGDGIVTIPDIGTCRADNGKLVFIPAGKAWSVEIILPGQTLEIEFFDLNNFYCKPYFLSLIPLCREKEWCLAPLYTCSAMDEYVEHVLDVLYTNKIQDLADGYELFTIFGVYYPKSEIANFLYPFLKTLQP